MSVDKLQREISKQEDLLRSLERRGAEAQSRASAAQSKRRDLASDALLAGLAVPERECEKLDAEAQKATRESGDCGAAAARVSQKLDELRRDLAIAERNALKAKISELISQRRRPLTQLDAAVKSLLGAVRELDGIDSSLADLIATLSGARFAQLIQTLRYGHRFSVRQFVENAFAGKQQTDLAASQSDFSEMIDRALQGLPIGNEDEETDGLVPYRALVLVSGLRSQTVKPGDKILLNPDDSEVAELVKQGALVAVAGE